MTASFDSGGDDDGDDDDGDESKVDVVECMSSVQ